MRRDFGNEVVIAFLIVAVIMVALASAVLLSDTEDEADATATQVALDNATDTPTVTETSVPTDTPTATDIPPTETATATDIPASETSVPTDTPTATDIPASETSVPTDTPTATDILASETSVPTDTPTATDILASETSVTTDTPTATDIPPSETSVRTDTPTATDIPPSETSVPTDTPAATNIPPSETSVPTDTSTATDIPPTETFVPTNTPFATETDTLLPTPTTLATATPTQPITESSMVFMGIIPTPPATPTVAQRDDATRTPSTCRLPQGWREYRVESGNTLFAIALATGSTVDELRYINCIEDIDNITTDDVIFVPRLPVRPVSTIESASARQGLNRIGCTDSRIQITSPISVQRLSGTFTVYGTADRDDFLYYKIEIRPDWATIYNFYLDSSLPVNNGVLGTINAELFDNGLHWILLTVVNQRAEIPAGATCEIPVIFG
ncbi:MAG: LysM peptidoglycan-binding domain-containing protein [Anaerolineae bacterium]|nr:LysM peptidoglycan-binding domain-containing protein [Anaerolineae bacterium]